MVPLVHSCTGSKPTRQHITLCCFVAQLIVADLVGINQRSVVPCKIGPRLFLHPQFRCLDHAAARVVSATVTKPAVSSALHTSPESLQNRVESVCSQLQTEITLMRQQKTAVARRMEAKDKEFRAWRTQREREVLQLRRTAQRNVARLQQHEAMAAKHQVGLGQ